MLRGGLFRTVTAKTNAAATNTISKLTRKSPRITTKETLPFYRLSTVSHTHTSSPRLAISSPSPSFPAINSSYLNPSFSLRVMSTSAMKPWPHPVVESHGDYRSESYLEDHIGGALYSQQHSLPKLPVPSITETLGKFLPTALPLAENDEEKASLMKLCKSFEKDGAAALQARLIERKEGEMKDSSWLQHWWNTLGYLQVRDPVVVNVSYFFHFSDDGTLPQQPPANKSLGVLRAASLLHSSALYRHQVATGSLPFDAIGRKEPKTSLCSVAYKYMFNACRIPQRDQDSYKIYDPSLHTHCIIACGGRFYSFDFVDSNGQPLPLPVLEDRLQKCVDLSKGGGDAPMLGYLTSNDRDSCADAREELIKAGGPRMEEALKILESGALLICLDENEQPVSKKQASEIFWTGSLSSGRNRWFDKSIQLICTNNGKAGMNGEHSMMDGMPVVGYCDFITKHSYRDVSKNSASSEAQDYESAQDNVKDIFADCLGDLVSSSVVTKHVDQAKANFDKLISSHELQVQSFQGYGSTAIKKMGYSPDAFVQIAMQLATYRLWGEQGGTYEATQVRPFLHGRTETTRSVSPESEAFVKKMGLRPQNNEGDSTIRKDKLALLSEAVNTHVKYIGQAAKAMGVDRHFLGLALSVKEGETAPPLFSHPLFIRSKTWRVSTSHLTHPRFDSWGYGEVVPNGVGLAYSIHSNHCMFCITALREHDWPERLSHLLEEALLEMRTLHQIEDGTPNSKL